MGRASKAMWRWERRGREVFSKDKGRWHKFRARTSSANWSGSDRLTEEEERRDLRARDKIRKQGGWSYDLSKEL